MRLENFKAVLIDLDHTLVMFPKPGRRSFFETTLTRLVKHSVPESEIKRCTTGSRQKRNEEREKTLEKHKVGPRAILDALKEESIDENNAALVAKVKKFAADNETLLAFEMFNKLTEHSYKQKMIEENKMSIVPYAEELLKKIKGKGKKIAIVTVTPEQTARMQLRKTGLSPAYFEFILGCDQNILERKPSPKQIIRACNRLRITPKKAIMIGDSETDVIGAKTAGAYSIQVMGKMGKQKPNKYFPNLKKLALQI